MATQKWEHNTRMRDECIRWWGN